MDWLDAIDAGFAVIRSLCRRVVVGGFSTGAGLALDLAARVDNLAGVFAVCPPLKLQDVSSRFVPAVDAWNRLMDKVRLDKARKLFVTNHPEKPHINYIRNPISGVRELERLMARLAAERASDSDRRRFHEIAEGMLKTAITEDDVTFMRLDRELFADLEAYVMGSFDEGLFVIEGKYGEGVDRAEADAALEAELEELRRAPVDAGELEKVRHQSEAHEAFGNVSVLGKAMKLAHFQLLGDAALIHTETDRYRAVTAGDIQRVAREVLRPERANTLHYLAKRAVPANA